MYNTLNVGILTSMVSLRWRLKYLMIWFYVGYLGPYTLFFCFKRNFFVRNRAWMLVKNLRKYSDNSQAETVTKSTDSGKKCQRQLLPLLIMMINLLKLIGNVIWNLQYNHFQWLSGKKVQRNCWMKWLKNIMNSLIILKNIMTKRIQSLQRY